MATPTFVFINDYGGFSVLTNNLSEVISSMVAGGVTHAVFACGYFDFAGGVVTVDAGRDESGNPISGFSHTASFYSNVINQMHAAGIQVIAWMMDGATYDSRYTQVNLEIQYLPLYLPYIKQLMDMGFDGYCDDMEYWLWTDTENYWRQWANWENALANYLHNGSNFANGQPRISCPAVGIYNDIANDGGGCIGSLLVADYNLIMFYVNEMTDPSVGTLWYPEVLGQYTANPPVAPPGETEYPANPFTPLTPVIIVLMVPNGVYSEINGYTVLDQINYYTNLIQQWQIGELGGFGLWVWECMNYVGIEVPRPPADTAAYWSAWNTFVNITLPSFGVPEFTEGGFAVSAGGPYTIQAGVSVQLNGFASGGVAPYTSWSWDFGDGSQGSGQNPTHTFASTGPFTVTLTVTDSSGATKTAYTTASAGGGGTATLIVESTPITGVAVTVTEV